MFLVKCTGCGEIEEVPVLPVHDTILDKICVSDELKVKKCDFQKIEPDQNDEDEDTDCELSSTFSCSSQEIHEKCGKTFGECECNFVRELRCVYRGTTIKYCCTCHPLNLDCECWHDQIYDPDGLFE